MARARRAGEDSTHVRRAQATQPWPFSQARGSGPPFKFNTTLLNTRQVLCQLAKGRLEPLLHRLKPLLESLMLLIRRLVRRGAQGHRRLAVFLGEGHGIERFQRPGGADGMLHGVALLVGERQDGNDPFRRFDLLVGELAPHLVAIVGTHAVVEDAARLQVQRQHAQFKADGTPPLGQALRLHPRLEYQFARRVEGLRDDKVAAVAVLSFLLLFCGGHALSCVGGLADNVTVAPKMGKPCTPAH